MNFKSLKLCIATETVTITKVVSTSSYSNLEMYDEVITIFVEHSP